jgi:hypothetical protein
MMSCGFREPHLSGIKDRLPEQMRGYPSNYTGVLNIMIACSLLTCLIE